MNTSQTVAQKMPHDTVRPTHRRMPSAHSPKRIGTIIYDITVHRGPVLVVPKEHDRRDEAAAASLAPGDQDRQIRQLKRELKEAKVKMWNAQDDADEADACNNKLKAKAKANRAGLKAQVTALHTQLDCIKFEAQATKQELQQQVEGLRFQVHRAEQQVGHPDTSNRPPSQFVAAACTSSDPVPYDAIWFWVYPLAYFVIVYYSWQFSLWAMAKTCVNLWAVHHVVNCLEQWAYPIPEVD